MTTPRTPSSPAVAASAERRGLFALIADVPKLIGDLVRAEVIGTDGVDLIATTSQPTAAEVLR